MNSSSLAFGNSVFQHNLASITFWVSHLYMIFVFWPTLSLNDPHTHKEWSLLYKWIPRKLNIGSVKGEVTPHTSETSAFLVGCLYNRQSTVLEFCCLFAFVCGSEDGTKHTRQALFSGLHGRMGNPPPNLHLRFWLCQGPFTLCLRTQSTDQIISPTDHFLPGETLLTGDIQESPFSIRRHSGVIANFEKCNFKMGDLKPRNITSIAHRSDWPKACRFLLLLALCLILKSPWRLVLKSVCSQGAVACHPYPTTMAETLWSQRNWWVFQTSFSGREGHHCLTQSWCWEEPHMLPNCSPCCI